MGEEDISFAIRTPEIDMLSSEISAIREVRDAMTDLQRKIGQAGSLVAEGRDMGTVVFPDAEHKFFLTASIEVRAQRRHQERINRGERISLKEVIKDLKQRDHQDETRYIAPMRPAKDATIIDTTALNPDQVLEKILEEISSQES
jgi:cytidylate kinase